MEAIASFDAHTSDDKGLTTSYDSSESVGIVCLSNVNARPAHERCGIQPGIVRMVNDISILVVSLTRGNVIRVAPQCVMMNSEAQQVMIGKGLPKNYG